MFMCQDKKSNLVDRELNDRISMYIKKRKQYN
jgi:hypothetical protein